MLVRRLLHAAGYRYRLHARDLPGKPDLVFRGKRKAIFVHGCFWHQHEDPSCLDGRRPKSNTSYWHEKLEKNVKRDAQNQARLSALGWEVFVVWECETKPEAELLDRRRTFLDSP